MTDRPSLIAARVERARWTWRGNRQLVNAGLCRSLWLTLRALFQTAPKAATQEVEHG